MTNGDSEWPGKASGPSRRLLALLVGLLAALALIVSGAGSASAQNAVGPQPVNSILAVGPHQAAGQENVGVRGPPLRQSASATGVAADTAGDLATSCANSFTADTPVTLADGKQEPISKVKVGDKVLATDPQTGKTQAEPVVALIRHSGEHSMVLVTLADGSVLDATGGHKIWDATQRTFVDADQLAVGDKIETDNGRLITVAGLTTYSASLTAYNLQISTIHTYYAGTTPILVHNSCDGLLDEATAIADHSNARALAGDGTHYVRGVHPDALGHYVDGVLEGKVPNLETKYGLPNGRTAYWDPGKGAVVFDDGAGGGSVFTPRDGYAYFEGLK